MRERKYVKFRSDMYEDTKFKIIDMKPERDMIHYVWTRFVTLAGKVNMEGDLYMSRNLPYTIETLAIEFNRSEEQIKLASEVFIELEMIEMIDGKIYRVKNFTKHQNIKVREKVKSEDKEGIVKNIEVDEKEIFVNEACDNAEKKSEDNDKESENNVVEKEETNIRNEDKRESKVNSSDINKQDNIIREISCNISQNNIPISLEDKKNKKAATTKKKEEVGNVTDKEDDEDDEMFRFSEGEFTLGEGEETIASWTF